MKDVIAYEVLGVDLDRYGDLGADEQASLGWFTFFGGAFVSTLIQVASMDVAHSTDAQIYRCVSVGTCSAFVALFTGRRWWIARRKRPALLSAMKSAPLDPPMVDTPAPISAPPPGQHQAAPP